MGKQGYGRQKGQGAHSNRSLGKKAQLAKNAMRAAKKLAKAAMKDGNT